MADLLSTGLAAACRLLSSELGSTLRSTLQGPENGSPFVKAPLPFEEIKAAPDRALEVILLTVGVMFLAGLATAAFLALSKLRSIEETVEKELRQLREGSAEGPARASGEGLPEETLLRIEAALQASLERSVAQVTASIEATGRRLSEAAERSASPGPAAPPGSAAASGATATGAEGEAALVGRLDEAAGALLRAAVAQERVSEALLERLPPITPPVDTDPGQPASGADRAAPDGTPSRRGAVLDRIHVRLAALGFSEVEIVTPRDELTGERLLDGQVQVEARRSGAVHKGVVTLEDGSPVDVQLRPSHSVFP